MDEGGLWASGRPRSLPAMPPRIASSRTSLSKNSSPRRARRAVSGTGPSWNLSSMPSRMRVGGTRLLFVLGSGQVWAEEEGNEEPQKKTRHGSPRASERAKHQTKGASCKSRRPGVDHVLLLERCLAMRTGRRGFEPLRVAKPGVPLTRGVPALVDNHVFSSLFHH